MLCRGCGNEMNAIEYCSNCNETGDAETAIRKVKNPYIPISTTIKENPRQPWKERAMDQFSK